MTTTTRFLSIIVLLIATTIGVIGKFKPQLFLRIPYGFIPWAITGNPMPPWFKDDCLYKEHWDGQKGDVVLSTGAKAGTLWIHTIVFLLRSNGWDGFDELPDFFDTCEYLRHPDNTLEQRLERKAWKRAITQAKQIPGFQIFTHKFPRDDAKLYGLDPELNPDVKYIAVVRNGKEVVKSLLPFLNGHTEKFRKMWGSFPPKMKGPEDALKLGLKYPDFFFGHLLAWWKLKHLPNVLLLHYHNLRQDQAGSIQQIANFLEIELTPQLKAQVLHKSSLQYMSHPSRTIKYTGLTGHPNDLFSQVEENKHIVPGGGKLDKGIGFFTEEMTRRWEMAMQHHLGHDPALVEFANSGVRK